MKMMGMGLVLARWRCNSRPSMFGIETSRTTQDTLGNCGESRKLRAEVKLVVWNPIDLSRLSRASQTDASSSTIAMRASFLFLLICFTAGILAFLLDESLSRVKSEHLLYLGIGGL